MDKVEELVEWVAEQIDDRIAGFTTPYGSQHYTGLARQILSHPDLALIDKETNFGYYKYWVKLDDEYWHPVIPLAEHLKEA